MSNIIDGEYVIVHSHVKQNQVEPGSMVVHIMRFQNERIVEMWDVGQPIPEKSQNEYGVF